MDSYQLFIISAFVICLCLVSIIHLYFRLFSLQKRKQSEIESIIRDFKIMFEIQNDLLAKIINNKASNKLSESTNEQNNIDLLETKEVTTIATTTIETPIVQTKPTLDQTLSSSIAAFRKNK